MADLRDELRDCAEELRLCADAYVEQERAAQAAFAKEFPGHEVPSSPYAWRGSDGHPVLAKILASRAVCLAALASLGPDPRYGIDVCGDVDPVGGRSCTRPPGHRQSAHTDDTGSKWGVL